MTGPQSTVLSCVPSIQGCLRRAFRHVRLSCLSHSVVDFVHAFFFGLAQSALGRFEGGRSELVGVIITIMLPIKP
jgi:hypothetical protein